MFEEFTDAARRAVVLAQEAARELQHDFIGTEHVLLGLLARADTVAGHALAALGISADSFRRAVIDRVGTGTQPASGHIPFTPRGKSTLEHSLHEAVALDHPVHRDRAHTARIARRARRRWCTNPRRAGRGLIEDPLLSLDVLRGAPPAENGPNGFPSQVRS